MDKIKVLFIMQLPPPVHGASMMNKYIQGSSYISKAFETFVLPLKFVERVEQIGSFSWQKIWFMIKFIFSLIYRLGNFKPDVVYFTMAPFGFAFFRDALFISIIKLFNVKIILHLHGKGIKDEVKSNWKKKIYQITFKNTKVITLSHLLDSDIKDVFFESCINLGNGIPVINRINNDNIEIEDNDTVEILYLSNFVESKGILVLIESIEILMKSTLKFEVNLVGSSADLSVEDIQRVVKERSLEKYVNVLGPLYGDEKWVRLQGADIFVFPTYFKNECFPLVLLEAMQTHNAVISTDNGAIEDMLSGCGIVVPQKDPIKLADEMRGLIRDRRRISELSEKAYIKFKKEYTLEVFERNFVEIIEQVNSN
jgi:glycosyltransferase involved in cell wall biosynthesis